MRKSVCQEARRYSPSVIDLRPTASCFLISTSISRSSTALSAAASISPRSRLARASLSAGERSRLPTWSARNGGFDRSIDESAPHLLRKLHDHPQLRPLLVFGQNVALLGRGEAALRGEAELLARRKLRGLVDAALDVVLLLQRAAFGGDEAEHHGLVAFRQKPQRLKAARAL